MGARAKAKDALDDSAWPILVIRSSRGPQPLSNDDFGEMLDMVSPYFERGKRFVLVVDSTDSEPLSAIQRKALAARMKQDVERHPNRMLGFGLVLDSAAQRGMLTALLWLFTPPYPVKAFAHVDKALAWARELLLR